MDKPHVISGETPAQPSLIPQPNGGALLSGGMPGNAGGTGRPPKSFATFMKELRESPNVQEAIRKVAEDPDARGFAPILEKMAAYDREKPGQKVELGGPDGAPIVVKVVREGKRVK